MSSLARLGRSVTVPAGQVVCHEGEWSDSLYVLLSGEVSVYRHDHAGRRVALRQFRDGDYFGEVALLDSKPRTATVASLTECRLFVLDQAAFRELLTSNPSLFLSVLAAVADRVREQVEDHYRAELENLRLEAQAEIERHRSLAQMVAGVAHELNTPLGITNTAIDMIANRLTRAEIVAGFENSGGTKDLETICEATSLAQRNIARAHQLIQDFKKVSVDQFVDSPQWEDLAQLVAASVDLFRINARRANLTIEVDDRLPATSRSWFGYPGHLTQVVLNLLTNIETYAYERGTGVVSTSSCRPLMPRRYRPSPSRFAIMDAASPQSTAKGCSSRSSRPAAARVGRGSACPSSATSSAAPSKVRSPSTPRQDQAPCSGSRSLRR